MRLFVSFIGVGCKEESYLKSKEYKEFHRNVFMYKSREGQDYDILYFVDEKEFHDDIMNDTEVIFV